MLGAFWLGGVLVLLVEVLVDDDCHCRIQLVI